jgi:hypothetical protein
MENTIVNRDFIYPTSVDDLQKSIKRIQAIFVGFLLIRMHLNIRRNMGRRIQFF